MDSLVAKFKVEELRVLQRGSDACWTPCTLHGVNGAEREQNALFLFFFCSTVELWCEESVPPWRDTQGMNSICTIHISTLFCDTYFSKCVFSSHYISCQCQGILSSAVHGGCSDAFQSKFRAIRSTILVVPVGLLFDL
jgi:hypothetical protein